MRADQLHVTRASETTLGGQVCGRVGCVAVWLCGCVAVWLCGCVAVWLCGLCGLCGLRGCGAAWLWGCVAVGAVGIYPARPQGPAFRQANFLLLGA